MMMGETLLIPKTASHDGTMRCIERGRLNKINPIDVKEWIVKYTHENV